MYENPITPLTPGTHVLALGDWSVLTRSHSPQLRLFADAHWPIAYWNDDEVTGRPTTPTCPLPVTARQRAAATNQKPTAKQPAPVPPPAAPSPPKQPATAYPDNTDRVIKADLAPPPPFTPPPILRHPSTCRRPCRPRPSTRPRHRHRRRHRSNPPKCSSLPSLWGRRLFPLRGARDCSAGSANAADFGQAFFYPCLGEHAPGEAAADRVGAVRASMGVRVRPGAQSTLGAVPPGCPAPHRL